MIIRVDSQSQSCRIVDGYRWESWSWLMLPKSNEFGHLVFIPGVVTFSAEAMISPANNSGGNLFNISALFIRVLWLITQAFFNPQAKFLPPPNRSGITFHLNTSINVHDGDWLITLHWENSGLSSSGMLSMRGGGVSDTRPQWCRKLQQGGNTTYRTNNRLPL